MKKTKGRSKRNSVSIKDVMICWTAHRYSKDIKDPTVGNIILVPWPDESSTSTFYSYTAGACDARIHEYDATECSFFVMSTALGIIVDYGLDPNKVHEALWPIEEYRDALPEGTMKPRPMTGTMRYRDWLMTHYRHGTWIGNLARNASDDGLWNGTIRSLKERTLDTRAEKAFKLSVAAYTNYVFAQKHKMSVES